MSQVILQDGLMQNIIKAGFVNADSFVNAMQLQTFKNDIDPDPTLSASQFEATTYTGGATTTSFTFDGPAKNLDGEWHLICLAGVNRSNSDTVASGPIYGYWVNLDTADAGSFWFAEKFDSPINLPIGGLLNISPELVFPLVNGTASIER